MAKQKLWQLRSAATQAHRAGDLGAAMRGYARYLAAVPGDAGVWSNLGVLHRAAGRHMMALRAHRRATALQPDAPGLVNNLANILSDLGRYDESIALRRALLEQKPDDLQHLAMIGRCLRGKGDYPAAIAWLTEARSRFPDDAELQMQLAFAQLAAGDHAAGMENYKARWRAGELKQRDLPIPEWQGEDLAGKRLIVLPEQGHGDAVLFARFLPVLAGRGAHVTALIETPLFRLLQPAAGADAVTDRLVKDMPYDFWVNMMDLGALHFAASRDVPAPATLTVPADAAARAQRFVAPHGGRFRVGVVWSGSTTYKGNAFRSFSHADLLALSDIPGVQLFSLYKGPLLDPFHADGSDAFVIDTGSGDRDFADCAAMMQQMDLVITSDTATAHIAGSLGVPVWCVLHWDPFWVFGHRGATTEWYPGMRLFRQETPLVWDGVLAKVAAALQARLEGK